MITSQLSEFACSKRCGYQNITNPFTICCGRRKLSWITVATIRPYPLVIPMAFFRVDFLKWSIGFQVGQELTRGALTVSPRPAIWVSSKAIENPFILTAMTRIYTCFSHEFTGLPAGDCWRYCGLTCSLCGGSMRWYCLHMSVLLSQSYDHLDT